MAEDIRPQRIHIVSDGSSRGTKVHDPVTGVDLTHLISAIEWRCDAKTHIGTATITMVNVSVEASADTVVCQVGELPMNAECEWTPEDEAALAEHRNRYAEATNGS